MKHIFFLVFAGSLFFTACKKDVAIGPPIDIEADYTLPQGDAPKEANDKIQQLYDTYGSYFLYNFTQKDFEWAQSTSTGNSKIELLEPLGTDSPIRGFLEKNPAGGIHHVCYEVSDIVAARDD